MYSTYVTFVPASRLQYGGPLAHLCLEGEAALVAVAALPMRALPMRMMASLRSLGIRIEPTLDTLARFVDTVRIREARDAVLALRTLPLVVRGIEARGLQRVVAERLAHDELTEAGRTVPLRRLRSKVMPSNCVRLNT